MRHRTGITLHEAAKRYFDGQGYGKNKKLPAVSALKQECAALLAGKKKLYSGYRELKDRSRKLLVAKGDADRMLDVGKNAAGHDDPLIQKRHISHDR